MCVSRSELGSGHRPSVGRTCLDYHCQTPQDQSTQVDPPHPPSLAHRPDCQSGMPQVAVRLPRPASWSGQRAVAASGSGPCAVCVPRARGVGRVLGVRAVCAGEVRAPPVKASFQVHARTCRVGVGAGCSGGWVRVCPNSRWRRRRACVGFTVPAAGLRGRAPPPPLRHPFPPPQTRPSTQTGGPPHAPSAMPPPSRSPLPTF